MTYLDYVMQLPKVIGEGLSREGVAEKYCPDDLIEGMFCGPSCRPPSYCKDCWNQEIPASYLTDEPKEEEPVATKTIQIPGDDKMLKPEADSGYTVAFNTVANELMALYTRKNHDYGNSFADTWRKLGPISGITRISDKFNRLCNLMVAKDKQQVKGESIEDTLSDLACYSIMAMIELRRERGEYDFLQ